jgi:hypothetical protein
MLNRASAHTYFVAAWGLLGVACASDTGDTTLDQGSLRALATASAPVSEALELAMPERGFQVESDGVWIDPGDDVRLCEVLVLPTTPATPTTGEDDRQLYYVNRIQGALFSHSEDLIVRAAVPGSDTAAAMDRGAGMQCTRAGEAFGEELSDVLRSSTRYADERFPSGVGKVFQAGQKLAVEYHVVNDTRESVLAKAKLAFHLVEAAQVQHRAHMATFENFTIYTPPHGRSSHVGECKVKQELYVSDLARRTQRFGTSFKVWYAGGDRDGELLWDSTTRQQSRLTLTAPLRLLPGEGFRFQCDYENRSARELRYGVSADDETCTLDAMFWMTDEASEPVAEDCLLFNVDSDGIARPHW